MDESVVRLAQRDQILHRVIAALNSENDMVHIQPSAIPTDVTTVRIALKYLLTDVTPTAALPGAVVHPGSSASHPVGAIDRAEYVIGSELARVTPDLRGARRACPHDFLPAPRRGCPPLPGPIALSIPAGYPSTDVRWEYLECLPAHRANTIHLPAAIVTVIHALMLVPLEKLRLITRWVPTHFCRVPTTARTQQHRVSHPRIIPAIHSCQ